MPPLDDPLTPRTGEPARPQPAIPVARPAVIARPIGDPPAAIQPHADTDVEQPPRAWGVIGTVLLALIASIVLPFLVTGVVGFVVGVWNGATHAADEVSEARIQAIVSSPWVLILSLACSQLGILFVALKASTRCGTLPRDEQFGFHRGVGSWRLLLLAILGSFFMAVVGSLATAIDFDQIDSTTNQIVAFRQSLTGPQIVVFVAVVALAPGFIEEIFFRGYVLRRLLRSMRPLWAILLTSCLFALVHLDLTHIFFAFPVGVWLGFVAWRTGSIRIGIACHAILNALWNIWSIGVEQEMISVAAAQMIYIAAGLIGMIAFGIAISDLHRLTPPMPAGPSKFAPAESPEVSAHA